MRYATWSMLLLGLLAPVLVFAYYNPGQPTGYVNDYAGVLDASQRTALETKLRDFEQATTNQIFVAIIPTLDGDDIVNFAVKLFADWQVGQKSNDNGVLFLIAIEDRKMRFEVGYGLEGALTDAQSFWIEDSIVAPAFRAGDYYAGIDGAVDKIMAATKGEYVPGGGQSWSFNTLFWLILFPLIFLARVLGATKSWWLGGVIGGVVAIVVGLIAGFLFTGVIALAALIPLGLLFDFLVSRHGARATQMGHRPWWWHGGPPAGGGFGGGFGGFGGGGGRSGGGGASHGW